MYVHVVHSTRQPRDKISISTQTRLSRLGQQQTEFADVTLTDMCDD